MSRYAAARGATSTVAVVLLVAVVVLVSATVFAFTSGVAGDLREPSFATVSVEQSAVEFEEGECVQNDNKNVELAVNVTLTSLQQADTIYVIVVDEGADRKKTVWDDPGPDDVGETKTLANEDPDDPKVDVDVGATSGDIAYCPGDSATFEFYAETDGQTTILQRFELSS